MALFEQLPLTLGVLALISLVVCAGTVLQVATGVGLGLLSGPVLILSLQSETAIFVAIILNLIVSIALLRQEMGEISWPPLRLLLLGTLVGVPLGWLVLQQIEAPTLKLFAGIVVLGAAIQLILLRRQAAVGGKAVRLRTLVGGGLSGFMSGSLAIPGPVAMWTLLRQNIEPSRVRATLRALFVFSYGAAFLVHLGLGGETARGWSTLVGGGLSGFMSGSLAIPGPVAMWTLLRQNIEPSRVRATLRALFVFSYGAAFLVHFGLGGETARGWSTVAALVPALAVGVALGVVVKRHVREASLHIALRLLLLVMGLSLLWKGISDVTA